MKHGVDSLCGLCTVRFINATRVHPKVLQAVESGLSSAESNLIIARLALAGTIYQVSEGDLLGIRPPCVRKYGIAGKIVAEVLG